MNKLLSFNNVKKVVLASSFLMVPNLAFSNEVYEDQTTLTDEQFLLLQELSDYSNQEEYSTYRIESKSKKGSDAIMGEWNISYTYNTPKQDRIVMDSTDTLDDGEIYSLGSYYPNQTGEKLSMFCLDINAKYVCVATGANGDYIGFEFNISGDTINNGYFATAFSIDGLFDGVDGFSSKKYPLRGFRGTGTQQPTQQPTTQDPFNPQPQPETTGSEASYDDRNNELTIPVLNYNGSKYRVVLQGESTFGKIVFSVKESTTIR